jgi:hypothetical protein
MRERENLIINMKVELEKYFYESNVDFREIYIADPDRYNLEMYNELCLSKDLYEKVCKMLNSEKGISAKHLNTIKVIFTNIGLRGKNQITKTGN